MFLERSSSKVVDRIWFNQKLWLPWQPNGFFKQFFKNRLLWNRKSNFVIISQKFTLGDLFSSPEHRVLSEVLWSLTVCLRLSDVRLSVHNLLVNTLASTNINQSTPNLVKMYMTTRAQMSSSMELIGPELSELTALELENLPYLTMFIL